MHSQAGSMLSGAVTPVSRQSMRLNPGATTFQPRASAYVVPPPPPRRPPPPPPMRRPAIQAALRAHVNRPVQTRAQPQTSKSLMPKSRFSPEPSASHRSASIAADRSPVPQSRTCVRELRHGPICPPAAHLSPLSRHADYPSLPNPLPQPIMACGVLYCLPAAYVSHLSRLSSPPDQPHPLPRLFVASKVLSAAHLPPLLQLSSHPSQAHPLPSLTMAWKVPSSPPANHPPPFSRHAGCLSPPHPLPILTI